MSSISGDDDTTKDPQQLLDEFWENLITKKPGKVTNVFPPTLYANLLPHANKPGTVQGRNAAESYQAAADECRARVKRIVRECHRTNEKFTDPEFDIENDQGVNNCLEGLMNWYADPTESGPSVSPWQLGEALKTLADSNVLLSPAVTIDVNAAAGALDSGDGGSGGPGSIHRVDWVFEKPAFTIDGFSSSDVQQGRNGDCWWLAAVATICSNPSL
jgi:hypothetical protein